MQDERKDRASYVPQDIPELYAKHRWKRGTNSARLFQAAIHLLLGLIALFLSKDFVESFLLASEPELKFALAALGVISGCGWVVSSFIHAVESYLDLNFFSQCFVMVGVCASVMYLSGASRLGPVWAVLIFAGLGCGFFELIFTLWRMRRRDAEQIHRLKRLGQLMGLCLAFLVAAGLAVFLGFRP